jgi:predicted dehydrogenase
MAEAKGGVLMKKITAALLGAGNRGMGAYAPYQLSHPEEIEFVAVAEPDEERREKFRKSYHIKEDMCFWDMDELLERPRIADAILICTQDRMHYYPVVKSMEKGYHILLEKPISPDPAECLRLGEYAAEYERIFAVAHVLRYTSFFSALKSLLSEGKIGELVSIQHNENVGYYHYAHSYVRGNWSDSKKASPMILAKSCHDMDILIWLAGSSCSKISSFGSLKHFKAENMPKGAPERCLEGCPAENECPYYAPRLYLTEDTGWPTSVISEDTSMEARTHALLEGPYGRCVYRCGNNVVDHQVAAMEFENGVTAAFTMCGFTGDISRTIKLMGTRGEIRGHFEKNEIEILDFASGSRNVISLKKPDQGRHGGGDYGLMRNFLALVRSSDSSKSLTSAAESVQSHFMAFAAEKSRLEGRTIVMKEYVDELKKSCGQE